MKVNDSKAVTPTGIFLYNRKQLIVPAAGTLQLI